MNYIKNVLVVALLTASQAQLFAAAGRDVSTNTYSCCVGNCVGPIVCQTGTANAKGDTQNFTMTEANFIDLGTINATGLVRFRLPTETQDIGYRVIFPGALGGQQIKFIGTYKTVAGRVIYTFYRQLPGEIVWTEIGELHAEADVAVVEPIITPDGAIISIDRGNKLGIMYVATQARNVPAEARPLRSRL